MSSVGIGIEKLRSNPDERLVRSGPSAAEIKQASHAFESAVINIRDSQDLIAAAATVISALNDDPKLLEQARSESMGILARSIEGLPEEARTAIATSSYIKGEVAKLSPVTRDILNRSIAFLNARQAGTINDQSRTFAMIVNDYTDSSKGSIGNSRLAEHTFPAVSIVYDTVMQSTDFRSNLEQALRDVRNNDGSQIKAFLFQARQAMK